VVQPADIPPSGTSVDIVTTSVLTKKRRCYNRGLSVSAANFCLSENCRNIWLPEFFLSENAKFLAEIICRKCGDRFLISSTHNLYRRKFRFAVSDGKLQLPAPLTVLSYTPFTRSSCLDELAVC